MHQCTTAVHAGLRVRRRNDMKRLRRWSSAPCARDAASSSPARRRSSWTASSWHRACARRSLLLPSRRHQSSPNHRRRRATSMGFQFSVRMACPAREPMSVPPTPNATVRIMRLSGCSGRVQVDRGAGCGDTGKKRVAVERIQAPLTIDKLGGVGRAVDRVFHHPPDARTGPQERLTPLREYCAERNHQQENKPHQKQPHQSTR